MKSLKRFIAGVGKGQTDATTTISVGTIYSDKFITQIGYDDASNIGSLGSQTFYRSQNLSSVFTQNVTTLFLVFDGTLAQDFFDTLYVDIGGVTTAFTAASATFSAGAQTSWYWTLPVTGNVSNGNIRIVG